MRDFGDSVTIQLPPTVRLPARFAVEKLVKQAAENLTGTHLMEWHEIVGHSGENPLGVRRFVDVLNIQFFRNIVLRSRYHSRFYGNIEAIDRAIGQFLGKSTDSVKAVRLEIDRRLSQQ